MRVVFFDAVHAGPATENTFSFPIYATRCSRMLKKSASLSCPFGLLGLSGLSRLIGLFGLSCVFG
jgi:hypothetical protein